MNTHAFFKIFPILLFLNFGFSQELEFANPESVGISSERLEFLTQAMNTYVEEGKLPGAVVLLARKGKTFYFEGFGQSAVEKSIPITKNSIFRIASQTKAIVSVATMLLQEEGKLNINHPVSKYIPEFKETTVAVANEEDGYTIEKAKREITIRDLLTHTSGMSYGYGPAAETWKEAGIQGWYFADRGEPILETVKRMAKLPMDAQPGEKWIYGYNTDVLGAVVEVASGQPLDAF